MNESHRHLLLLWRGGGTVLAGGDRKRERQERHQGDRKRAAIHRARL
jgi:hypothetical protein